MIARLYSLNKQFINLNGKLLALPKLTKAFIMDALGYGWDRNRAIDSKGNHNNALMGGYLLAASNTVIAITGILTTDTIKALTKDGLVGTIAVNGTISFSLGLKYGAFEVYRGTARIGRYCLTERQGLQIINQVTGGLTNGQLGCTTTTVWQKSNAFYCETNHTGYSISATGWVTSAGAALTVGTIIPADPLNPTKCMAWVSGVQQDLQYFGKARNSVSVVPLSFWFNFDRYYLCTNFNATVSTHEMELYYIPIQDGEGFIYGTTLSNTNTSARGIVHNYDILSVKYYLINVSINMTAHFGRPTKLVAGFNNGTAYIIATDLSTGFITQNSQSGYQSTVSVTSSGVNLTIGYRTKCYFASLKETLNGTVIHNYVVSQHSNNIYDTVPKTKLPANGITTNLIQNIDCGYNFALEHGYELWVNGTDYQIYPLASDGTRIITPAGYTLVETVTAGNMPSIADSRMSTFKYALANSYAVRQSVPEAYNVDAQATPKLLTYSELSALSNNDKVYITESNGKITNIKAT